MLVSVSHIPAGQTVPRLCARDNADAPVFTVLVIPGVSRNDDTAARRNFENALIAAYRERRRIILLCGAVFRLDGIDGLRIVAASMHANAKMVNLNQNGEVENFELAFLV